MSSPSRSRRSGPDPRNPTRQRARFAVAVIPAIIPGNSHVLVMHLTLCCHFQQIDLPLNNRPGLQLIRFSGSWRGGNGEFDFMVIFGEILGAVP